MRMRRCIVGAVLFLSLTTSAQQKPAIPAVGETIEVSIVNVDVFVTDKAGHRIHGLTKDDFEILENGKPQPITNFSEYRGAPAPSPAETPKSAADGGGAPPPPPQKRTIILFVERMFLDPPERLNAFFATLDKTLHDVVRPGDRAMVLFWDHGVLVNKQPFTDSLPALDDAVDKLKKLSSHPLQNLKGDVQFMLDFAGLFDADSGAAGFATNGGSLREMQEDYYANIEKQSQQRKVETIKALIRTIAADEGKKIMLLSTHRLSRQAGMGVYLGNTGITGPVRLEAQQMMDMSKEIRSIEDAANANGVTLYPLFPEGLDSNPVDPYDLRSVRLEDYQTFSNETSTLKELAEETGGLTAWGTDTNQLLPKVTEDLESYYSLAYRTRTNGTDKGRTIVVKTKNPAFVVRSRREFMDKSDQTRFEDRVIAALFGNTATPGFPLNVAMGKKTVKGNRTIIPLVIHIPLSALTQLPDRNGYAGAFSVYFAWGGTLGGFSDTSHQTKTYTIPPQRVADARQSGHLTYNIDLSVDQKTERIAFGVFDEVSKDYALRLIQLR